VIASWHSLVLDAAITERHSTRMFLPKPAPRALVDESLALAQHAPSNSNIQPWHMVFASWQPRDRLVAALLDAARREPPKIPPLSQSFQQFRRELGAQVYGAMGIAPEDMAKHAAAVLRNWEFFRAPLIGIVCMHRDLGPADALSAGMYLQTLLWPSPNEVWGRASKSRSRGILKSFGCSWLSRRNCWFCVARRLAIPTQTFLRIACTLAVSPSTKT